MTTETDAAREARFEAARQRINREAMPRMMARRAVLMAAGFEVVGVVLPADMDPGAYDGPDATDAPAMLMGVPVVWGATFAVLVRA